MLFFTLLFVESVVRGNIIFIIRIKWKNKKIGSKKRKI